MIYTSDTMQTAWLMFKKSRVSWDRQEHDPSRSCGRKLESTLKISKGLRDWFSVHSMYFGALDHQSTWVASILYFCEKLQTLFRPETETNKLQTGDKKLHLYRGLKSNVWGMVFYAFLWSFEFFLNPDPTSWSWDPQSKHRLLLGS